MIVLLRSLLFTLVFYAGSVVAVLLALPVALAGQPALIAHARRWALFHHWCARVLLGITTRVEGVLPVGPALVAVKHESMFETLEMLLLLDRPAVVLKRELADIPLWGRVARLHGVIVVDRAAGATAMRQMLKAAKAAVARGRPILIFPEGTRVPHGARPPLRAGFAGLYKTLSLPVVPVACDSGRLCPRRRFLKRPGIVTFRVGAPIAPGLERKQAEALVHAAINALNPPAG
ncbi:lysophospholipid acyltransferase family protein [Sphingomonas flavalba]|uniref:lysophospholipid acyltransferase family protein n=1 Tax=Sphingomonas flavalba TaxID=2559804 RepID=UPI00109E06F6|nr:lysophospholipid acyltransferase family protein [Sphingomonas flavalba]